MSHHAQGALYILVFHRPAKGRAQVVHFLLQKLKPKLLVALEKFFAGRLSDLGEMAAWLLPYSSRSAGLSFCRTNCRTGSSKRKSAAPP